MARATKAKTPSQAPAPVAEETSKPDSSERARQLTMGQKKED
jgi:hypothetical protein